LSPGAFIGDRASKSAFWEFVDKWGKPLQKMGKEIAKKLAAS
jgi:hypothetical protein